MAPALVDRFGARYPFGFDDFQLEALEALVTGESVLVAAPTGSGKTVIGEFAVWLALQQGGKAFYTTPLKALSNQKFNDFTTVHGAGEVGLLTGDNSINPDAPAVVMTTEVLRNMIYERSERLADLHYVILDEVHYLQDPYRGAVWEEVIIHLPVDIEIVCLSATVSNAEEFADWIQTVRGPTKAIIEEKRPVRLQHHYLIEGSLHPMFVEDGGKPTANPEIARMEVRSLRPKVRRRSRGGPPHRRRRPHRSDVIELLSSQGMLPAIYFIFSRKGCNSAVHQCMREGVRLTNEAESSRILQHARAHCEYLPEEDLEVLGYPEWLEALSCGIAAHHAGLIPVFKETVEDLFQQGLVKAVFATETLSLGINMPARTVVIESLSKFTGERHEILTPGEFTQFTGRAGRRGIDSIGHAVVPQQSDIPFTQIAGLASTRTYPLVSSFQPSYNMATNLIRNYSQEEAGHLLNSSFAQYRSDKEVVILEQLMERNDAYLASYREKMAEATGQRRAQWAGRAGRLEKQNDGLRRRIRSHTEILSRKFDRILKVLEEFGYVEGFALTEKGWALARIYNENDLLVAESLIRGWLTDLDPPELAAVASVFVFESRGRYEVSATVPTAPSKKIYGKISRLHQRIRRKEEEVGLDLTRGPEAGFSSKAYAWCNGEVLEDLIDDESPPGDFIRNCKQTLDLLNQLKSVTSDENLRTALEAAYRGMNRGVVAYTGLI